MTQRPWELPEVGKPADFAANLRAQLPVLETERLKLRVPVISDYPHYAEILMAERSEFLGGPFDRQASWYDFSASVAGWLLNGYGYFYVETHDGTPVGFVGVLRSYGDIEPELGYFLVEDAEGNGYATEAATAVRDWAKSHQVGSLCSYIYNRNTASANVATKLGAIRDQDAEAVFKGTDCEGDYVFRHWQKDKMN